MRLSSMLAVAVAAWAGGAAAQAPDDVFRIGIETDMNGVYSYVVGRGSVEAVRMAVEDFGGKVLGKRIEVLTGDDQNKPDITAGMVRRWIEADNVKAIVAGSGSATTIAAINVAKEKNRTLMVAGAGSSDITGKFCGTNVTHWVFDTYGLAATVGKAVVAQGGKTWFFVSADYSFGQALQRDTTKFIEAGGGKVLGDAKHPLNSADFASYLLQAKASGAQVIGFANAGADLVNAIKQAREFGIVAGGQRLAGLLLYVNDIQSLGLDTERYKLLAFTLSAALSGLAGSTKAISSQIASLTDVHWSMSGEVLLMTFLGGVGTLFGPVVGAFVVVAMQNYLSALGQWVIVIHGAIFVLCVLAFRRGIVGELLALFRRREAAGPATDTSSIGASAAPQPGGRG